MAKAGKSFITNKLNTSEFCGDFSSTQGIRFVENVEGEFLLMDATGIDTNM